MTSIAPLNNREYSNSGNFIKEIIGLVILFGRDLLFALYKIKLARLNALTASAIYFELDTDLVQVAAETSRTVDFKESEMNILISRLSEEEKNRFLTDLLENMPDLSIKLKRRLKDFDIAHEKVSLSSPSRTFSQLSSQAEELTKLRQEKIQNEKRAARIKELQNLAANESAIW